MNCRITVVWWIIANGMFTSFEFIHPDQLTPSLLMEQVLNELRAGYPSTPQTVALDGLRRVTSSVKTLLDYRSTREDGRREPSFPVHAFVTTATS